MDRLLELYLEVSAYPKTCNLTPAQKSKVFVFINEFNKELKGKTKTVYPRVICARYGIIEHCRKYLIAHGKL